jgi:hypothetical protein
MTTTASRHRLLDGSDQTRADAHRDAVLARAACRVLDAVLGAGRFDGCHHRERLLMRDRRENRGFRVYLPDGRRL